MPGSELVALGFVVVVVVVVFVCFFFSHPSCGPDMLGSVSPCAVKMH